MNMAQIAVMPRPARAFVPDIKVLSPHLLSCMQSQAACLVWVIVMTSLSKEFTISLHRFIYIDNLQILDTYLINRLLWGFGDAKNIFPIQLSCTPVLRIIRGAGLSDICPIFVNLNRIVLSFACCNCWQYCLNENGDIMLHYFILADIQLFSHYIWRRCFQRLLIKDYSFKSDSKGLWTTVSIIYCAALNRFIVGNRWKHRLQMRDYINCIKLSYHPISSLATADSIA